MGDVAGEPLSRSRAHRGVRQGDPPAAPSHLEPYVVWDPSRVRLGSGKKAHARRMKRVLAFAVVIALVFASTAQARKPVVFVHGFCPICGTTLGTSEWDVMAARFQHDGWPQNRLVRFGYDTTQSNATSAAQLAATIDAVRANLGVARVDVVAHSMGSLVTRYCVKHFACDVRRAALIAGPNHGTYLALACALFWVSCKQMERGSRFLANLNAGDETPDVTRWATWRSPCDELVLPHGSAKLYGAANYGTECLGHIAMVFDSSVYTGVRNFLTAP